MAMVMPALRAQQAQPAPCGTTGITPWFDHYRKHRKPVAEQYADTNWLYVPVTLHLTGTSAGTGHYPFDQAMVSLCITNDKFAPARIRFYLAPDEPVRYLNNSSWHRHDYSVAAEMVEENYLPGRLNAFVVADPAGNCGYSGFGVIVLGQNCSGDGYTTWPHEAGHHFSLPHTFVGWEGYSHDYNTPAPLEISGRQVEWADGSNCWESGDFFCDTEADYLNARWTCNGDGRSPVLQMDPLGQTFRSDGTLLMGYADQACRARFTVEQIAAMRENLRNERSDYLQWPEPAPATAPSPEVVLLSPVDSQAVQFNKASFSWNAVPNTAVYYLEVSRYANFSAVQYRASVIGETSYTFPKSLINNNTMYWRVTAYPHNTTCPIPVPTQVGVFRTRNLSVSAPEALVHTLNPELLGNPVANSTDAVLQLTLGQPVDLQLQLRDAGGRVHHTRAISVPEGASQWTLDTRDLPAGYYFISLQTPEGAMNLPLVLR